MLWRAECVVRRFPLTPTLLAPVPVPAFAPGFPLVSPAAGAAPDGAVLPLGSELVLVDGVGEGGDVVLPLGFGVGLPDTIGAPLDACPGLYGSKLGLQDGEPDWLGAVKWPGREPLPSGAPWPPCPGPTGWEPPPPGVPTGKPLVGTMPPSGLASPM